VTDGSHPFVDANVWRSSDGLADCIAEEAGFDPDAPAVVSALPPGRRELVSFLATSSVSRLAITGRLRHEEERPSDLALLDPVSSDWLVGSVIDTVAIEDPARGTVRIAFDLRAHRGVRLCTEPLATRLALLGELARDRRWPASWGVAPSGRPDDAPALADRLATATGVRSRLLVRRLGSVERELGRGADGRPFSFA
jgi:hypothetical protein